MNTRFKNVRAMLLTKRSWLALLFVLFVFLSAISFWPSAPPKQYYRMFESPDKRFRIIVEKKKSLLATFWPVMPGQGGDMAGRVYLVDVQSDRILQKEDIEMVNLTEEVVWSRTNASVALFIDWPLP
jgi:hypothetical protein